jgi:hypothetical protein
MGSSKRGRADGPVVGWCQCCCHSRSWVAGERHTAPAMVETRMVVAVVMLVVMRMVLLALTMLKWTTDVLGLGSGLR